MIQIAGGWRLWKWTDCFKETLMTTKTQSEPSTTTSKPEERRVKDLSPRAKETDGVRGGARRTGGDDDLDDLEVER